MRHCEHGGDIYANKGIILDFSVNLNPLGIPPGVRQALMEAPDALSRYPDRDCRALTGALSRREGVPPEQILCGNGAADLIYRLCFGLKPKRALICAPTFAEYGRAAGLAGATLTCHRLREEEGFAVTRRILADIGGVELVFLCNPNNPTGQLVSPGLVEEIASACQQAGALLLMDECFLDFTPAGSAKGLMNRYPGLVLLKAFTKTYAMAGLRLGYLLTRNARALGAAGAYAQPWSVSAPAQLAGVAALEADGWLEKTRAAVAGERGFLEAGLSALGLKVYPGQANFLLMKSSRPLYGPLLERGLLVRSCAGFEGLDERFIRVCVKTREENTRLLAAIKEVLYGQSHHDSGNHVQCGQNHCHNRPLPPL